MLNTQNAAKAESKGLEIMKAANNTMTATAVQSDVARHIHLTDAEAKQENESGPTQSRHEGHQNQQNVRGQMGKNHSSYETEARSHARSQQRRDARQNICAKEYAVQAGRAY